MRLILPAFAVGVVFLYFRRTASWGRRWLTAVLLGYWALSTPMGSTIVAWPLAASYRPIASRDEARGAQAVVMLGGGTTSRLASGLGLDDLGVSALRVIETARVYRLLGTPLVVVSGGNTQRVEPARPEALAYRAAAMQLGVPADRIVVEDRSMTTRDQALLLKPILAAHGVSRFVLVTSPTHLGRALAAFRAVGLDPVPSAAALRSDPGPSLWSPLPDSESLLISDNALYDAVASVYYRANGWLRRSP